MNYFMIYTAFFFFNAQVAIQSWQNGQVQNHLQTVFWAPYVFLYGDFYFIVLNVFMKFYFSNETVLSSSFDSDQQIRGN